MFYFRAFGPTRPYQAYNAFARSRDPVHQYGVTYHFYCAVNEEGKRGIALATSVNEWSMASDLTAN